MQLAEDKLRFKLSWFILCVLNYLQNDLSHKKVQTCSLCLWSLTFINLLSALKGCGGNMKIMKQCLCFWVLSGNRPATVCMFCVLVQIALCTRVQDICMFQTIWGTVCPCVNVTKGLSNGRGTYSGIRGSYPIHLRLTLLREVWGQRHNCSLTLSMFTFMLFDDFCIKFSFKSGVTENSQSG